MGLLGNSKGRRCKPLPEGGYSCIIYKNGKGGKVATGDEAQIIATPETGCEPMFINGFDMTDEGEEEFRKIGKQLSKACKEGIA